MKKPISAVACILLTALLVSCKGQEKKTDEFKPSLDPNTACSITIVGDYKNFEALEAEFDRFNVYYPKVELAYEYIDDYANKFGTVLERENKPNIFFTYTSWTTGDPKYDVAISHMDDLSNPALKINLDCLRPGLINHDANGKVLMVPIFSRTYGMLINDNLFKEEGINIPKTWDELSSACESFVGKGYESPMMGYSLKSSSSLMNTIAYPSFVATLANNKEALALANNLDPKAGPYMRESLEKVQALITGDAIDLEECDKIEDSYAKVVVRFFQGDVPMMICEKDTVSRTKKEEQAKPFDYSFHPIPLTDKGGYFIDSPSIEFSINKECENLDMTREFMRFLVNKEELNNMASIKRLVTPAKEMTFDPVYAPFGNVPEDLTFSPEAIGIKDPLVKQIRIASFKVGRGELTIDEAIDLYGKLE